MSAQAYEMVQTYGAAATDRGDAEPRVSVDEHEALLGEDATVREPKEGRATIHSSVGNLANTIIGSGELHIQYVQSQLTDFVQACLYSHWYVHISNQTCSCIYRLLVQALATAGIIPGMLTCLFSGSVAAFGLYLLSLCAVKAPHRRASFFAIAEMTFPKAAVFFDAAIAIKCFGVSIRCAGAGFLREHLTELLVATLLL